MLPPFRNSGRRNMTFVYEHILSCILIGWFENVLELAILKANCSFHVAPYGKVRAT